MNRSPRYWRTVQPRSMRHAIELCLQYTLHKHRNSVEEIAALMGLSSHWTLYKYQENGRIPAILIRPFEHACRCNYISQYIANSAHKLLIDIPTGRKFDESTVLDLQTEFNEAINLLHRFYRDNADPDRTIDALLCVMGKIAMHKENVSKASTPELPLFGEEEEE